MTVERTLIRTTVEAVEEKKEPAGMHQTGEFDPASGKPVYIASERNLGWFVRFAGSHESLHVGDDRPYNHKAGRHVEKGDPALIMVEFG